MKSFRSIEELLKVLAREKELLKEMFAKRKSLSFRRDLAGVNIFLTEFYAKIGSRARFLVPPDAQERLLKGSTARYDDQYQRFRNMQVTDPRVQPLVDLIHECHRGYDQEGFIE